MPPTTKAPSYKTGRTAVAEYAKRLDYLDQTTLALWAAECAEHVLPHFEVKHSDDHRPRKAIEAARAWARGEIAMAEARVAAVAAHAAARNCDHPAARAAARATGHAAGTAHMSGHALQAAAYAVTAAVAATPSQADAATASERDWQIHQLPREP